VVASCKKETEDTTPKYSAEIEAELIKDWLEYVAGNGNDVDTTSTGLFYIVENEGTGPTVLTGDSLTVKYVGFFMDGVIFDNSLDFGDGTYSYIHKDTDPKKRMISGWEDGVEVMRKGSKAVFLIPSEKAYGVNGYGRIPPYTPLLFQIEIVDIK
jgi:FKBP-type peptidyl-prolyl cis-trans isomerase FkpA